ncbi:MAG TPA: G1 family glutamic endopeptidase [Roseiarcus sp.]
MAVRNNSRAEAELKHFHTFRLPPRGFNVLDASDRELMLHGLPRRPNPETHPLLADKWSRLAARRFEFIEPKFEIAPFKRSVDVALVERRRLIEQELLRFERKELVRDRGKLMFDLAFDLRLSDRVDLKSKIAELLALLPETSSNWSGAYVKRPASEPLMTVTGQWNVNGVSPPFSATGLADGTYLCGVWVGIDGTQGTNDVLQAGTGSQCVVTGGKFVSTSFFAWTEWFSLGSIVVANFPVAAGDEISCTVCAPFGNTHGTALFNNLTSGLTTTIGINPPAAVSLSGNVAEWIVEDPSTASNTLYPFPNYGSTFFNGCTAGTKSFEFNLSQAKEIDMVQGGVTLSSGVIQNKSTLWCHYGP